MAEIVNNTNYIQGYTYSIVNNVTFWSNYTQRYTGLFIVR